LLGRAFGNRDGSIHILKDGTLDQILDGLEKWLDLELCPCCHAIFADESRLFEHEAMLTCEPIHPRSAGFDDAFARNGIDLSTTASLAKKTNARVEPLGSELKTVIDDVEN
jgi:hypothetical protein